MLIDSLVSFVPIGSPLNMTAGTQASNIVDLLGLGVGVVPTERIIGQGGNGYYFGEDAGIGGVKPQVQVNVGTAFTTSDSATLNVQFQGAPDTANGQPGTWTTFIETGAIAAAELTAEQILARFDFPPSFPAGEHPRFLRLNFVVATGLAFTAGTISSAIVTMDRDDWAAQFQAPNYVVGAVN
jgi:hypothetical protein